MNAVDKCLARWLIASLFSVSGMAVADEADNTAAGYLPVEQNRYLEAAAAAQRGDYVIAYCIWRPLAEQGDAEAQYALGWMYHNGYGLVVDDKAAKGWWEKAVAQGHLNAMFSLGTLYSIGNEAVARDYGAAMRLWVLAATAGHENARFAVRELALRNLPELSEITRTLRTQYPQLLGISPGRKNLKSRQSRKAKAKEVMAVAVSTPTPFNAYGRGEEWFALAAGYRPEYGWAAAYLIKEGGQLIATLQK